MSEVNLTLKYKYILLNSNNIPLEGLSHRLVVAAGDLQHEVLVHVGSDFIDSIHCCDELILLLTGDVEDSIGVLSPLALDQVPYPLDGVVLGAVGDIVDCLDPLGFHVGSDQLAAVKRGVIHKDRQVCQRILLL